MIKTNVSVYSLFSRLLLSALCIIMGLQALATEVSTSDISEELKNLPVGNRIDWFQPELKMHQRYMIQLVSPNNYGNGKSRNLDMQAYNLASAESRAQLSEDIKKLNEIYKIEKNENEVESQASKDFPIAKDVKVALKYLNSLNEQLSDSFVRNQADPQLVEKMYELSESINMNYKDIIFPKIQLGKLISIIFGLYNSRVGEHPISMKADEKDPANSSFWQKPAAVQSNDTFVGFSRSHLPDYSNVVFEYKKAKTGYGTHAGFRVEFEDQEYKIRLGQEARIAPFSARILHALGFNSLAIDYAPVVRVKYDKKIFREFNARKGIPFQLAVGKLDLLEVQMKKFIDPFKYLAKATMKNGQSMTGLELKKALIDSNRRKATLDEENYIAAVEEQIEELQFTSASIEKIEDSNVSVGPWSWDEVRHVERRDFRGYGLLAAWLGQYDARTENTRLMLVEDSNGQQVLRHYITDVGSGLGKANPLLFSRTDDIEHFRDTVVKSGSKNDGQMISKKFQTFTTNYCFEATNAQDGKWMIQYIDQLTESQIKQALRASGFTEVEANEAYRKLMLRKENIRHILEVTTN